MGVVHRDAEVKHHVHTSPVAQANRHTVRIHLIEVLYVFVILHHIRTEFLLVCLVHIRDSIKCRLNRSRHRQLKGIPYLFLEVVKILLLLRCRKELQVGVQVTQFPTVSPAALHQSSSVFFGCRVIVLRAVNPVEVLLCLLVPALLLV